MPHRILIVDDDPQILRLVESYLSQVGYGTLTAADGEAAMHALRRERPDLVVLDLMLPGRDGLDILRWLRADATLSATPVLLLTARVDDEDKIVGLELGADDYLTKPFNPREVVARVRALLRRAGAAPTTAHILQHGRLRLDVDGHSLQVDGAVVELTPTEFALLKTLLESPGHAFTRAELIERALGYSYEGFERTLDSHVKNLRRKIEVDPAKPGYIETVFGVGYRLSEDIA